METHVSYKELVEGKKYIIYRLNDNIFWKGTFCGQYQRYYEEYPNLIFIHCIQDNSDLSCQGLTPMNLDNWKNRIDFCKKDIFHDVDQLKKNSKYARECMEQRSLDIVLKRLVNEHFEW
jgi:hypothetical protein